MSTSTAALPDAIGRYLVREVLGTGNFATVYRATDEHLDVDVAVKVLAENHSLDPDIRQRFLGEGRRLRRLRSPHVVAVHDLGDTERAQPYLVLDLADRGDLGGRMADLRAAGHRPTAADILSVARSVAASLDTLHRHQLIHRDLTPGNLLLASGRLPPPSHQPGDAPPPPYGSQPVVGPDEVLMLGDLGLSKDLATASGLTVAAGTSGFAPPEQHRSGGQVDERSDVWAASALIVWLLLGRPPGDDTAWRNDLQAAGWPRQLVAVLDLGLAAEQDNRQRDIATWLAQLGAGLGAAAPPAPSSGGEGPPDTPDDAPGARPPGPWRRVRAFAAVIGALLLGGTAGFVLADRDADGPPTSTQQDGDLLTTTVEDHGIVVELTGPTELDQGDTARLEAAVEGAETWQWVAPNGRIYPGSAALELAPASAGRGTARLLAFDEQGRMVEATHTVEVD
jgi:hypothetical protein